MATDVQVAQVVVEVTQSRTAASVQVAQVVVEVTRQRITPPSTGQKMLVASIS